MKIGIHLPRLTYAGGPATLGPDLAAIVTTAEAAGVDRISVMDHVWQIANHGPAEQDMLEAYTTLGFLAAHHLPGQPAHPGHRRDLPRPGPAGEDGHHSRRALPAAGPCSASGPPGTAPSRRGWACSSRPRPSGFERLEETLQIVLQMWSDDESPYQGEHYHLGRTLNSPQPLSRPHPPILIGGGGEKKTLRLVAQYAQACNLFSGPELAHKLEVLREHCTRLGRDYAEIEKTATYTFDLGPDGERVEQTLADLRGLADLGIQVTHGRVENVQDLTGLTILGEQVIPAIATW